MVSEIMEHDHEQLAELLHGLKSHLHQHDPGHGFELLDHFWARLAVHIRAENLWLFPAILNAPGKSFSNRDGVPSFEEAKTMIARLRSDHNFFMDELAKSVKKFRETIANAENPEHVLVQLDAIRERVETVSLRLESHNALEKDQVYKWPGLILSAPDLQNLEAALRCELENLPGRFAAP
jgi:iron-sulfur cluster repair protein YtfE (RIC family)